MITYIAYPNIHAKTRGGELEFINSRQVRKQETTSLQKINFQAIVPS